MSAGHDVDELAAAAAGAVAARGGTTSEMDLAATQVERVVRSGPSGPVGSPGRAQLAGMLLGVQGSAGNMAAQRLVAQRKAASNAAARPPAPSSAPSPTNSTETIDRVTDEELEARSQGAGTPGPTADTAAANGATPPPGAPAGGSPGGSNPGATPPGGPATGGSGSTPPGSPASDAGASSTTAAPATAPTAAQPAAPPTPASTAVPTPAPAPASTPASSGQTGGGGAPATAGPSRPNDPGSSTTAPPAPVPIPDPNTPTLANASSGINWGAIWDGGATAPNFVRGGLEIARIAPGWGGVAGAVADGINWWQDIDNLSSVEAPWTKSMLHVRNAISLLNNVVGHLQYIDELATDLGAISIVGVEIVPFTTTIHEFLSGVKLTLDGAQTTADFLLMCDAIYQRQTSAPGSPTFNAWNNMTGNYVVNFGSSVFTTYMDVLGASTGGIANTEVIKNAVTSGRSIFQTAKYGEKAVQSIIQGWIGVWGGSPAAGANGPDAPAAPTPAASAPAPARMADPGLGSQSTFGPMQRIPGSDAGGASGYGSGVDAVARQAFFGVVLSELQAMKSMYTTGDVAIGVAGDSIDNMVAELRAVATELLDGQDPFIFARDSATRALDYLTRRIGDLAQMGALASNAHEKSDWLTNTANDLLGKVDALTVPHINLTGTSTGVGVVDDVTNFGANMANSSANALLHQLEGAVTQAKRAAHVPLDAMKEHATEIGGFLQVVTDQATEQITFIQGKIADLSAQLAGCNNFEDVINTLVNQILREAGIEGRVEVDDIRQGWRALGTLIDDRIAWAEGNMRGGGGGVASRSVDDDTPEIGAADPPPPE